MATIARMLVLSAFIIAISGCGDQDRSKASDSSTRESQPFQSSYEPAPYSPAHQRSSDTNEYTSNDLTDVEDGEFDCTVTNITRNDGPYTLMCERDSDQITIHFPNGGYIFTDLEGLHSPTGEQWEIEENLTED